MKKNLLLGLSLFAATASAQGLSSGLNLDNLDRSYRPGDDFYQFATAGWQRANPLTAEYSRYGAFNVLHENNQKQLRALIEELANTQQAPGTIGQKIGSLYRLAMDSTRRNAEGYEPIRASLEEVRALSRREDYQPLMARLSRRGIPATMFYVGAEADLKNASQNLVQVGQGGLSLSDRDYYLLDDEQTLRVRNAYRQYVKDLFMLVGNTAEEAQRKTDYVLAIETQLAQQCYSRTKLRDVEANYHYLTYDELKAQYPAIDWDVTFRTLGYPTFKAVCVGQPEPLHEAEKILTDASLDALKAYSEFKIVNDAASALSDEFRALTFGFYGKVLSGAEQDRPRWKRAVSAVEGAMGMAVGRMYVEKYFPETSKQRMLELVKNLQTALGQRIDQLTWMSNETKKQAHEKLGAFYVKIGYPDKWKDYSKLSIDDALSYYENMCRVAEFEEQDMIERRMNQPVDRDEWYMTPQTINAYYNPTTNEICFPAGILQPPFFNPEADDAANYGAIGVVIGHEMTHGFDDQGSQFDKAGNLKNWWTTADKKKFDKRTKVMQEFFDKIEVLPGMFANGKLTLGENIADNGGLNVAFVALQNAMRSNPLPDKDGFTPEQRFFISFATVWAENIRDEQLRLYNKTDPHSPARWRVNGALPQIDAWYDAFGITKKDKLFVPKKKRVDVW